MKKKLVLLAAGLGLVVCMNAQTATKLDVLDTRAVNSGPNEYIHEVKFEFKQRDILGVPGGGFYSGLFTFAPWAVDNSGNQHHQLNFNDGGIFYRTGWPANSTWNSWRKLLLADANDNLTIPGVYNFEQVSLGQYGNGNCGLDFINHTGLYSSYGIRFKANVDEIPGLQIQTAPAVYSLNDLNYTTKFFIGINGNIGIGTTDPGSYKLNVAGSIRANEIKVNTTGADFVFEPTYKLRPLAEVETFINQHKHLPDVAPAADMQTNGVSMGEMQAKLLQKVEELTLYVIELKNENEQMKKEIEKIKK